MQKKHLTKPKPHSWLKTFSKLEIEENILKFIKTIYKTPTANIRVNDERCKVFPLRSGTKKACPLWPLFKNILLTVLANKISPPPQKGYKINTIGKEDTKVSLLHKWHDYLCRKSEKIDKTNINKTSPETNKWLLQGCRLQGCR